MKRKGFYAKESAAISDHFRQLRDVLYGLVVS